MTPFKLTLKRDTVREVNEDSSSPTFIASELLQARTQFHIWHLQANGTGSYAFHSALDEFYNAMTGFADSFVETIQGKTKSILKGYGNEPLEDFKSSEQVVQALDELKSDIEEYRISLPRSWANIDNLLQEVIDQIEKTSYKLIFLK